MACAGFKLRAAGRTVLLVWTLVSALAVTTHAVTTTHYYFPTSTATDPTGGIWPTDVQWNALSNL